MVAVAGLGIKSNMPASMDSWYGLRTSPSNGIWRRQHAWVCPAFHLPCPVIEFTDKVTQLQVGSKMVPRLVRLGLQQEVHHIVMAATAGQEEGSRTIVLGYKHHQSWCYWCCESHSQVSLALFLSTFAWENAIFVRPVSNDIRVNQTEWDITAFTTSDPKDSQFWDPKVLKHNRFNSSQPFFLCFRSCSSLLFVCWLVVGWWSLLPPAPVVAPLTACRGWPPRAARSSPRGARGAGRRGPGVVVKHKKNSNQQQQHAARTATATTIRTNFNKAGHNWDIFTHFGDDWIDFGQILETFLVNGRSIFGSPKRKWIKRKSVSFSWMFFLHLGGHPTRLKFHASNKKFRTSIWPFSAAT